MIIGIFHRHGEPARAGVKLGRNVLDLAGARAPHFDVLAQPSLNAFMARGHGAWRELREWLEAQPPDHPELVPLADVEVLLPATIGDYTDFYASIHHATNVGSMFRPDNPLLPNYKWLPVAYHGRASSIVPSGTPIRRPRGQVQSGDGPPRYTASSQLDYELEVGTFIGPGNELGEPIAIDHAERHVFGLCLVNDWSARDLQRWEYQPLGPFLAKNFATTISTWIVTPDSLESYRVPLPPRPEADPQPLPHLQSTEDARRGGFDISLEVHLESEMMRSRGIPPVLVSRGNFRDMYWTLAQMIAHHTSNGCNLRPGDLIASGTVSGPERESRGCLLERTSRGAEPLELPSGETRAFLEDGDEVILRGWCGGQGGTRVDFGECRGRVLGA
jgi:fumarylacetoacetase